MEVPDVGVDWIAVWVARAMRAYHPVPIGDHAITSLPTCTPDILSTPVDDLDSLPDNIRQCQVTEANTLNESAPFHAAIATGAVAGVRIARFAFPFLVPSLQVGREDLLCAPGTCCCIEDNEDVVPATGSLSR